MNVAERGEPSGTDLSEHVAGAVVVGDDGSTDAVRAVERAAAEARAHGVPLVVLRAWTLTTAPRPASWEPGYVPPEEEFEAAVSEALRADIDPEHGIDVRDLEVRPLPVRGSAVEALAAASRTALTVVVGARGRGLARALLGSTTQALLKKAEGAVLVVPHRD